MSERNLPPAVGLLALLLFFPALGGRDLWAPVEPRYAEIVRVMYSRGEWIVPTVNGALYTDKPILYFWAALAAAHLAGGVSEWVVRLPAALGGLGLVLGMYFVGREFFSARIGALAAFVLATSLRVIWESRWAHVDTLFCFFFVLTIYFGARRLLRGGKVQEILLAYAFMGLATLTKGLIGVVLPVLVFAAFAVIRRDRPLLRAAHLPVGIPLFLSVAAPWFYLVNRASGGQWLVDFIYIHHVQRYTSGTGHREAFYYYLTTLPVDFLPWTPLLIPAALRYRARWRRPETQFFLLWFAVVFLFFSASDTKRDLYLLPLLPTLALLVACYLDDPAPQGRCARDPYFWIPLSFFVAVALSGLALPIAAWALRPEAVPALLPSACALALGSLATAFLIWRRRFRRAALAAGLMMLALTSALAFGLFPFLEQFKSHRTFAGTIDRLVPRSANLYVYMDTTDDFNFYSGRERIPVLLSPAEIGAMRSRQPPSYLLIKQRDLRDLSDLNPPPAIAQDRIGNTIWHLLELRP